MPELYNWNWDKPPDLVERRWRKEVDERIDAKENIIKALNHQQAEIVIDKIATEGIQSLAICLINSYANPIHQEKLGDIVRQKYPKIDS